jgi:hypothetical protein
MTVPVVLVAPPKLITRSNMIVPSTSVHWSAIMPVMLVVSPKLITRPNMTCQARLYIGALSRR